MRLAQLVEPQPQPQGTIMRHAVVDCEHSAPLVQVLDVPVPQLMVIRQRTVDDMLQDLVGGEPLEEKLTVPQPVPPALRCTVGQFSLSLVDVDAVLDRAQQRIVEQISFSEQHTVDTVDIPVPFVEEPAASQERVQQGNC